MLDLINRKSLINKSQQVEALDNQGVPYEFQAVSLESINDEPSINAITLPCKVGQYLFRDDGVWKCIGFDCDQTGTWRVKLRKDYYYYTTTSSNYLYTRVVFNSFGKTVFTSREEYKKAFPPKELSDEVKEIIQTNKKRKEEHEA